LRHYYFKPKKTIMKIKLLLLAVITVVSMTSFSQNVKLNLYTNYVFDDQVDSYYSSSNYFNGKIKGGFQWGAGLEYMLHPNKGVELSYLRQDTKAPMTYASGTGTKSEEFDVAINWIMIGGNSYLRKPGGMVEGFGGFSMGAAIFNIENEARTKSNSATKFAWGIKLGANIWASEKVAIKLQANLMSAVQSAVGGMYFGTGGAGAGVSTYSTMYQFGLGGGLVFKLGGR